MSDDPAATSWTRGQTAAFEVPRGQVQQVPDAARPGILDSEAPQQDGLEPDPSEYRRRSSVLGGIALTALIASIVVQVVAITVASAGDYVPGTALAIAAIALSGLAVLFGLVAMIAGRGRILGIISLVLGVLTNPLVLVAVLGFLA